MPKQGEIDYLKNIGEHGVWHATHKPFSDPNCGKYLMEMGVILSLLPSPPARLLDLGCGTGWTSCFFAKAGYQVVGQDICNDMIEQANINRRRYGVDSVHFVVGDYEEMCYPSEFDCAVFFDSLHHSQDECEALRMVYRSLKPGGLCIALEPGTGHAKAVATKEAVRKFNVTERDMPPRTIIKAARKAGFNRAMIYPHINDLRVAIYRTRFASRLWGLPRLAVSTLRSYWTRSKGLVLLVK